MTAAAAKTRELKQRANHIARAEQKAAAASEVRRQRAVGDALDVQAQLDAVRGGKLVLPEAIAQGDLSRVSMVLWLQNVTVLSDLGRTAPSATARGECADKAAQRTHDMLKLILEQQGTLPLVPGMTANGVQPAAAPSNLLTREEAIEELKRRRVQQLQGTR